MHLTIELTRICFPYLLFMSLTALQSGVLNSLNRFTAAAAAPILLNIFMIARNRCWPGILGTGNTRDHRTHPRCRRHRGGRRAISAPGCCLPARRVPLVPRLAGMTPDVKRVLALSVPGIISGGIMQINLLDRHRHRHEHRPALWPISIMRTGCYQLPLGVIGRGHWRGACCRICRASCAPVMTQAHSNSQNRALELSLFLTIPAAVALMVIRWPILHTVLEHGAFTAADTLAVAPSAVLAFAAGLPAFAMTKVFQPGFYAREDTRTPMHFAIASVASISRRACCCRAVRPCRHCAGNHPSRPGPMPSLLATAMTRRGPLPPG